MHKHISCSVDLYRGIDSTVFTKYLESNTKKPSKLDLVRNWEFKAKNGNQIKFDSIAEDLTPENPIAFVYSPDNTLSFVVVLTEFMSKSTEVGLESPTYSTTLITDDFYVLECPPKEFTKYVDWAKAVKKAKWPITNPSRVFKVRIPVI